MYIEKYINSKDIRKHLTDIGYSFNSVETAWLILQSKSISMKERHNAWEELMAKMPDSEIPAKYQYTGSLFDYLNMYMQVEKEMLASFWTKKDGCVFFHNGKYKEDDSVTAECFDFFPFSSVEKSIDSLFDFYGELDYENITITKQYINGGGEYDLVLGKSREVVSVLDRIDSKKQDVLSSGLAAMSMDFPVPFKKGDIVYSPLADNALDQRPFVFLSMVGATSNENDISTAKESVSGYQVSHGGKILKCNVKNYLNLEYYKGSLEREKASLNTLSGYVKGKIDLDTYTNEMLEGFVKTLQIY